MCIYYTAKNRGKGEKVLMEYKSYNCVGVEYVYRWVRGRDSFVRAFIVRPLRFIRDR